MRYQPSIPFCNTLTLHLSTHMSLVSLCTRILYRGNGCGFIALALWSLFIFILFCFLSLFSVLVFRIYVYANEWMCVKCNFSVRSHIFLYKLSVYVHIVIYASSVNKNWYGNENSIRFNHDLLIFWALKGSREEKYTKQEK